MPVGAYSQDTITRIINVHWAGGGAVFVFGEWLGNKLHCVKIVDATTEPEIQTISLPEPPNRDLSVRGSSFFGVAGSSCAEVTSDTGNSTVVFLICGTRTVPHEIDDGIGNIVTVIDTHALIYGSNDGVSWRLEREQAEVIDDFAFQHNVGTNALVWHEVTQAFYYDQHYGEVHPHTGISKSSDQIFRSAGGTVWSMVSDKETESAPDYVSDFPRLYCKQNDCLDALGQHVPDGVMFTDPTPPGTAA